METVITIAIFPFIRYRFGPIFQFDALCSLAVCLPIISTFVFTSVLLRTKKEIRILAFAQRTTLDFSHFQLFEFCTFSVLI